MEDMDRQKELVGCQDSNRLHRATRNGEWLIAIPYLLNSTELSQEEFWDNLRLRYGLMPQKIHATCNGCGERLSIEHALSWSKGVIVLEHQEENAKEWGDLGDRAMNPSDISYKHKINSRRVQGGRIGAGARQEADAAKGIAEIVG